MTLPASLPLPSRPARPSILMIQQAVCAYHGKTMDALLSDGRMRSLAWPRQQAIYLCRELTPASYPSLGARFRRDHSTAISAVKAVRKRLHDHPATITAIAAIRASLLVSVPLGDAVRTELSACRAISAGVRKAISRRCFDPVPAKTPRRPQQARVTVTEIPLRSPCASSGYLA